MRAHSSLILGALSLALPSSAQNSTYHNPVLPGWHSDPSCTRVADTFFCSTSTFISFPGLPVYASKDLVNWRLISHAWNREAQLPDLSWNTFGQQDGMYAPTLRYHDGEFFVICEYLGIEGGIVGVVFRTTDPFDDDAWSDPVIFQPEKIDPDLFWDDDGKVYAATQGIILQELNLETGELSQPPIELWNGTGGVWPEGPHIYKKDGWYYLLIAEGGTGTDHAVTMARARTITGPYEAYEGNPVLTNRGTDEYFQTVGHADLFEDEDGNWWGLALATRSGSKYLHYPMGREAVMFPVTWEEGGWPVASPVRGTMSSWTRPAETLDVPGDGPFNDAPDEYDFTADTPLPKHFVHWRVPREGTFSTTASGLQILPSRNNLTGVPNQTEDVALSGRRGLALVARRQTHTLFNFTVDVSFVPERDGQEAGITVFLTQLNHIDVSVGYLGGDSIIQASAIGNGAIPPPVTLPLPSSWDKEAPIRLAIAAETPQEYTLSASQGGEELYVGTWSSELVSGGDGSFVGSLVGAYATCNGAGEGLDCPGAVPATFQGWRYVPVAQFIDVDESVPADEM